MNLWGKEAFTNLQPQLFKFLVWKAHTSTSCTMEHPPVLSKIPSDLQRIMARQQHDQSIRFHRRCVPAQRSRLRSALESQPRFGGSRARAPASALATLVLEARPEAIRASTFAASSWICSSIDFTSSSLEKLSVCCSGGESGLGIGSEGWDATGMTMSEVMSVSSFFLFTGTTRSEVISALSGISLTAAMTTSGLGMVAVPEPLVEGEPVAPTVRA
mmetsp:Transcript_85962/g.229381  ORF Transcript_85962/g.229381 Transcript_85962/m.229381 type:complete len:216 (+) Transcript_85962:496-1143(+)